MRFTKIILAMAVTGVLTAAARAEEGSSEPESVGTGRAELPVTVSLYVENDSIFFKPVNPTDRWYTSGVRLNLTHSPGWGEDVAKVFDWLPLGGEGEARRTAVGYSFIHKIFTPVHIGRRIADPDDHPYAGWLAFGLYLQRATEREMDHFEVDLGVVGPSARGEQTQNFIHDLTDSVEARGWDAQLHDEFGIDFIYARKWKFRLAGDAEDVFTVEAIPQVGFTLGTVHRQIEGGGVFRAGWNLPSDFGPGRVDDPAAATGTWTEGFGAYGYVRLTGRVVEHNEFIEGNNWESSAGVDEEPLVGEMQLGFAVQWRCVQLTYGYTLQTDTFESQSTDTHGWGIWGLSARLDF